MRRALSLLIFFAALQVRTVQAAAPSAAPRRTVRAAHQVRITPTVLAEGETATEIGDTLWSVQGYDVRGLVARVYDVDSARVQVEIPEFVKAGAEAARYDVSLVLNGDETGEDIRAMLRNALEEQFHIATSEETRPVETYVLTAPAGAGPGMRATALSITARQARVGRAEEVSAITVGGRVCPGISSAGITAQAATVEGLAAALEENLDRIVVDETHLTGAYDFQVPEYRSREELFSALQQQMGLRVDIERRELKVVEVRPRGQAGAQLLTGL